MTKRRSVVDLSQLGLLPVSDQATESDLTRYQELLEQIEAPVGDGEGRLLIPLFGPDECFGLAWTLLHLIERAPGWPLMDCLANDCANEWNRRLRERADGAMP